MSDESHGAVMERFHVLSQPRFSWEKMWNRSAFFQNAGIRFPMFAPWLLMPSLLYAILKKCLFASAGSNNLPDFTGFIPFFLFSFTSKYDITMQDAHGALLLIAFLIKEVCKAMNDL